jgi:cobalt-zinc-cadmium efflux system outer membrane protein
MCSGRSGGWRARETLELAKQFAPAAQKRLDAGRGSPVEVSWANSAFATATSAVEQQEGQLAVARKRLAALWGSLHPRFSEAVGDLDRVRDLPSLAAASRQLERNPRLARRDTELTQREAQLKLEQANARPSLTVSGGGRRLNETDDMAFLAGFSIPLPLFDRNQGGIQEARVQINKANDQFAATRLQLNSLLGVAYEELKRAKAQITSYRTSVIPQAEEAYRLTNEGYEMGRSGYLEVLDARRSLVDAQQQYVDALIRYHKAVAEIEGLTGQALPSNSSN